MVSHRSYKSLGYYPFTLPGLLHLHLPHCYCLAELSMQHMWAQKMVSMETWGARLSHTSDYVLFLVSVMCVGLLPRIWCWLNNSFIIPFVLFILNRHICILWDYTPWILTAFSLAVRRVAVFLRFPTDTSQVTSLPVILTDSVCQAVNMHRSLQMLQCPLFLCRLSLLTWLSLCFPDRWSEGGFVTQTSLTHLTSCGLWRNR